MSVVAFTDKQIQEKDLRSLYTLYANEEGKYYAIRWVSPHFCFEANSLDQVIATANRAIEKYVKWKDEDGA